MNKWPEGLLFLGFAHSSSSRQVLGDNVQLLQVLSGSYPDTLELRQPLSTEIIVPVQEGVIGRSFINLSLAIKTTGFGEGVITQASSGFHNLVGKEISLSHGNLIDVAVWEQERKPFSADMGDIVTVVRERIQESTLRPITLEV